MIFYFIGDSNISINNDRKKMTGDNLQTDEMQSENGKFFLIHNKIIYQLYESVQIKLYILHGII